VLHLLAHARALLFAPGSDAAKLTRALESEADVVVADLEDSVVPEQKQRAREIVSAVFGEAGDGPLRAVRLNGVGTDYFDDDLRTLARLDLAAFVLPKATPEAVARLGADGPPVVAIAETAQGIRQAYEIAALPRVVALALGAADLGAQLWTAPRHDGLEILHARSTLVVDSAAAGIRGPFDGVHLDVADDDGLEEEALLARSLGLRGKICIHPRQVPVVNRVFAPTPDEAAWAREVLDASEQAAREGRGALVVRGALVDVALVQRATRILDDAEARLRVG
jgi:citrate lyase subunit beta/citryl-CoA lyase